MDERKTLFCSWKFLWEGESISSKFTDNLGTRPQKFRQPCSGSSVQHLLCGWPPQLTTNRAV